MKIRKLSFIDVVLISTALLVSAAVFTAVRYNTYTSAVPSFDYTEELLVYPTSSAKVQVKVQAKAEVGNIPQQKPVAVPLPLIPPKVIFKALPEYPASALAEGLDGTVLLSVFVSKSGDAGKVEVSKSSGIADLDKAAVAAMSEWKFEAARRGGAAVESWYRVPVRFRIK